MRFKIIILMLLVIIFTTNPLIAADFENYYLQTSFLTHHYSQRDYQNNTQKLIGLERHYSNDQVDGLVFFQNTYNQNTFYLYRGKKYSLFQFFQTEITSKFTYGIIHGYDDENGRYSTWMHKLGTFPAIIFGLGLRREPYRIDILPFGNAGIIITGGIEF